MARARAGVWSLQLAITDHSQSLAMAKQARRSEGAIARTAIREVNARLDGFTARRHRDATSGHDRSMDLADDCLAELDLVNASIHSGFAQDAAQMTDRLLRAIACPWVDVIAHPLGRRLGKRDAHKADMPTVFAAAAAAGVAMEINAQIERLDLDEAHARRAHDAGVRITISSDAHSVHGLTALRWGVAVTARQARLAPADVLNTRSARIYRRPPAPPTMASDKIDEIRRLYFATTPKTIQRDLDRAIDLLKTLKSDDERSKAAVFMEGLNEMRKEWKSKR